MPLRCEGRAYFSKAVLNAPRRPSWKKRLEDVWVEACPPHFKPAAPCDRHAGTLRPSASNNTAQQSSRGMRDSYCIIFGSR